MKNILVIGSGRSAVTMIKYLLTNSNNNWFVKVADYSKHLALDAINDHPNGKAIFFDVNDSKQREKEILEADIVLSMLPASMHITVARDCVRLRKDLITASYVSNEIANLNKQAIKSGVLLLNEIGLDPGIDHMSAMQVINKIKDKGGELTSFKSFCGGLVHPNYDNNPWNYKFTWNPRNVVLAGQGQAQYVENGQYKYIPYNDLFRRTEIINILGAGDFEGYANRDSLTYRKAYGLEDISTILRGTLRRKGYCEAWNILVNLGLTDDSYIIENSDSMTNREFINMFLPFISNKTVEDKLCERFGISINSSTYNKLEWLGLFSNERLSVRDSSPAQLLQSILEKKWILGDNDKDMIVMQHQFSFIINNKEKRLNSSLLVFGDDTKHTAMAKTVGLPMGIAAKLILNGDIKLSGVHIPTLEEIYSPVLQELEEHGINFVEELI